MVGYYESDGRGFQLFRARGDPSWREPQLAALGAVLAQWSISGSEAPLVSVPTGVGKTAIALACPFLSRARRTLVVVPTQELRRQTVAQFRSQRVLRRIGALREEGFEEPCVHEIGGRCADWLPHEAADVVVGIPASISPAQLVDSPPPPEMFDLVIVDEAHHAPAATWLAILEHFPCRQVLLTATPQRRDRKRIPGKLVYYYPLRQALDRQLYQPVDPLVLDVQPGATRADIDLAIAGEVVGVLNRPEHQSSQFLVRASTKARANALSELYSTLGLAIPVLHSGLGPARQRELIDGLRAGTYRGVVMVGMLVEGFDLASLRVAGYHDKHKSVEPTAQLIGRLARVDASYPQTSVLVTARDIDVYPHLEGAVRELYAEDSDWARVLPGIIDAYVEDDLKNAEYARAFGAGSGVVDPAHLHPLRRATVFEVDTPGWLPSFHDGEIPESLTVGESFAGRQILYFGTNPQSTTLLIVTGAMVRPRWNTGDELDSAEYDLHVVSYRRAARADLPDLLLVNSAQAAGRKELIDVAGAAGAVRPADAGRLQSAFDGLERLSVSSVGVRNTYGPTRGTPSYKMFAGSSIESGLRDSDTAHAALGHAMVQVLGDGGAFTAGVSTGKAKYWETRYTPLRLYEDFVAQLAERYWYPTVGASGPLLPRISRGATLVAWPQCNVLAVALDYALIGTEWFIDDFGSLDFLDLSAGADAIAFGAPLPATTDRIPLIAMLPGQNGDEVIWTGEANLFGEINSTGPEVAVRRGHGNSTTLSALLTERPPTFFFVDGTTVRGREFFPPPTTTSGLPPSLVVADSSWSGVDITAETRQRAATNGIGISVHEWTERYLSAQPMRGRHRWILSNDGSGEIADYLVIETLSNGQMGVGLWHAKFAGGSSPSVRVGDFEVVTAQAIKSRRWPTDRDLWGHLAARLAGTEPPRAHLIEGRMRQLAVLLGMDARWARLSAARRKPSIVAQIGIVQPGLSLAQLEGNLDTGTTSAIQIVQLLTVFRDAVLHVADPIVVAAP